MKRNHRGFGDTFYVDEVFVKIKSKQHYLGRAVDQGGEVVDVFLQARRDGVTARRFFKHLLRRHRSEPRKIVTDKLRSYAVAHAAASNIFNLGRHLIRAEHYRNLRISAFGE